MEPKTLMDTFARIGDDGKARWAASDLARLLGADGDTFNAAVPVGMNSVGAHVETVTVTVNGVESTDYLMSALATYTALLLLGAVYPVPSELTMYFAERLSDTAAPKPDYRALFGGTVSDPDEITLTEYLEEHNVDPSQVRGMVTKFGKLVKKEFVAKYGKTPPQVEKTLDSGRVVHVNKYRKADRPVLDAAFAGLS